MNSEETEKRCPILPPPSEPIIRGQSLETGKQDLEWLFDKTEQASWMSLYESTLIYGAILLQWIKRIQRFCGNGGREWRTAIEKKRRECELVSPTL